jgi:hypothetical protein
MLPGMISYLLVGLAKHGTLELEPGLNRVGRNPTNDVRVSDASVSSFHCEITIEEDVAVVRDLCSTNGTFVDGQPIKESRLDPGQVLRLGAAEYRYDRVEISIPELSREKLPEPTTLADGSAACLFHPQVPAAYECAQCRNAFCPQCVKPIGLKGAAPRYFCPRCSGACAPLAPKGPTPKKASLFGRLSQTIRLLKK